MNISLGLFESQVRIVLSEPMSLDEFFQFRAENDDLRIEREPNGDLTVMTPTHGGIGFRGSYINRQLANCADEDERGFSLDSSAGCLLPDDSIRSADAAWIARDRWTPPSIE